MPGGDLRVCRYSGSPTATKLKMTGIDLFSAGDFTERPGTEDSVLCDPGAEIYKRLVMKANRIEGRYCTATRWMGPGTSSSCARVRCSAGTT